MPAKSLTIVIEGDHKGLHAAVQGAEGDLDQLEGSAKRSRSGFAGLSDGLMDVGKVGALALGGVAVAGGSLIGMGVKVAADMEQAQIGFTTMLGSADKAQAFLAQLRDFAAKTPFEFPELQTAASSLISIGIDASKVIPIMTTLGNVTSGMGTGSEGVKRATVALQQMNAAGRITAEDLNQLRDAGIPVFDLLAGATGKTKEELAGMAQNGKLGRKELEQLMTALETGKGLEKFNGLMDAQSQSLTGMWSTLKDTIGMGLAGMAQPIVESLKGAMPVITDLIKGGIEAITPVLQEGAGGVAVFFAALVSGTGEAQESGFASVMQSIGLALRGFVDFLASHREIVVGALGAFAVGLIALGVAELAAAWPALVIFAALTALIGGIVWAWNNVEWFRAGVTAAFQWLQANVPPAIEAIRTAALAVFSWLQAYVVPVISSVVGWIITQHQNLVAWVTAHWGQIQAIIGMAVGFIQTVVGAGVAVITYVWQVFGANILQYAQAIWGMVGGVISAGVDFIRNVIEFVMNVITGNWSGAWNNLLGVGRAVMDGMIAVVRGFVGAVMAALGGLASFIGDIGSRMWSGLTSGFRAAWNTIAGFWNRLGVNIPSVEFMGQTVGGGRVDFPDLPTFALGGTFRVDGGGAGLAVLHDGEQVFRPGQRVPGVAGAAGRTSDRPVQVVVNLNVEGAVVTTDRDLGRVVAGALQAHFDGGGRLPALVG